MPECTKQKEKQIDTKEKQADPVPAGKRKDEFVLITDLKAAGDDLAIYFDALLLFFRSLSKTAFSYHDQMGAYLNQIFVKALQCLYHMASIGQIGSFDFRQSFIQKSMLKSILQAKVIDKDFKSEASNIWFTAKLGAVTPHELGKSLRDRREANTALRELLRKLWFQQKDLQKYYENVIKRQLYHQFSANFKAGEQIDLQEFLAAQSQGAPQQTELHQKAKQGSDEQPVQKQPQTEQKPKVSRVKSIASHSKAQVSGTAESSAGAKARS